MSPWIWAGILGGAALLLALSRRARAAGPSIPPSIWNTCPFGEVADFNDAKQIESRVQKYGSLAEVAAREFGVPPDHVLATIYVESRFQPSIVNSIGAAGLMQLMPGTSKWMSEKLRIANDPLDPVSNVRMGTALLRSLYDRFDDWHLAHAAYFAGSGNVQDALASGGLPPLWNSYANNASSAVRKFSAARSACARVA